MAAKLKVWRWSDGSHADTVATTSRAKALAAWGVTRDLFKDGDAREITEGPVPLLRDDPRNTSPIGRGRGPRASRAWEGEGLG